MIWPQQSLGSNSRGRSNVVDGHGARDHDPGFQPNQGDALAARPNVNPREVDALGHHGRLHNHDDLVVGLILLCPWRADGLVLGALVAGVVRFDLDLGVAERHHRGCGLDFPASEILPTVEAEGGNARPQPAREPQGIIDHVVQHALQLLDAPRALVLEQEPRRPAEKALLELPAVVET